MDGLRQDDLASLERICPGGVEQNVDLAAVSQWRIGGRAALMLSPSSTVQLAALRRFLHERDLPHVVIGHTSNLLFADEGLHVPCIRIGSKMSAIRFEGADVIAEAGAWVPGVAVSVMRQGLTGVEHICGIPGTLGGLVYMNGGSQRKGIGSAIVDVKSVLPDGAIVQRTAADCDFSYRHSVFHGNDEVISAVRLRLVRGKRAAIHSEIRAILADRRRKFPRKEPNCGSVFKSNPAMYAEVGPPGAIIERLGFKGMRQGGAQVSPRHANFIVNTGKARAIDVLSLITRISDAVFDATGFRMEAEVRHVAPDGYMLPADQISVAELS